MIDLSQFKEKCNKGFCSRQTMKSKQCLKESKQELCYDKWKAKLNHIAEKRVIKDDEDIEWKMLKESILMRDGCCLMEKIMTAEERSIVEKQEGYWLQKYKDGAHLISRSESPKHIYLESNVIILGRFFHQRLDNYYDLITGEQKDFACKKYWITRIMQQNGYWKEGYTYDDFRKELLSY